MSREILEYFPYEFRPYQDEFARSIYSALLKKEAYLSRSSDWTREDGRSSFFYLAYCNSE
jgi:hypothetical protein